MRSPAMATHLVRTIAVAGLGLALAGCATARTPVALRSADDARPTTGPTRLYVLPDSTAPRVPGVWGFFSGDSLVLYRPVEAGEGRYRREIHQLGRSGLGIAGYTLAGGRHVDFDGYVKAENGLLGFRRMAGRRTLEKVQGPDAFSLAPEEVRSVDAWFPSAGRTALMIASIVVIVAAGAALSFAASFRDSAM